jgi:Helix-turn-helix domain of resolvase
MRMGHLLGNARVFTTAGLAAARARGRRRGGRPSVMSAHKLRVAQEMYRSGEYSVATIARTLGVSRASIYRHLSCLAASQSEHGPICWLQDRSGPSTASWPVLSWQLRSGGSSRQCAPDGSIRPWSNDCETARVVR